MVQDPDVAVVNRAVAQFVRMFERTRKKSFRPGIRPHFAELTTGLELEPQVRALALTRVELHATAAAALLGPYQPWPVAAEAINEMIEALKRREPDPAILLKFMFHLVLAYGLTVPRSWVRSFEELKHIVRLYLDEVNEWQKEVVPGVRDTFYTRRGSIYVPDDAELRPEETARDLTLKLQFPVNKLTLNPGQEMVAVSEGETGRVYLPGMDREWVLPLYSKRVFRVTGNVRWESPQTGKTLPIADGGKLIFSHGDDGLRIETRVDGRRPGLELQFQQEARLIGAHGLDVFQCSCGNDQCEARHWLPNWRPIFTDKNGVQHDYDLHCFVATAMKGPAADGERASQSIYLNSYVTGIHFAHVNSVGL